MPAWPFQAARKCGPGSLRPLGMSMRSRHQEDRGQPSPGHFVYFMYPTSRRTLLRALTIPHVSPDLMDGLAAGLERVPQEARTKRAREGCAAAWDT